MSEDLEQAGLDAVDRFLDTWNSRDPDKWAASLNYPHVRPSPFGETQIAANLEEYVSRVNYATVLESGWDHSEWDYKHVLQVSPRKIHVAGQWSRYNADGKVILTTPIVYICTKVDGGWGIQSRFSVDYADENTDTTGFMTRALTLVQDVVNHHNARNREAFAELLNFPHIDVGIGDLSITDKPIDYKLPEGSLNIESLVALQTGQRSMNAGIDVSVSTPEGTTLMQGVININERDQHLGIQAWSLLNPAEEEE